MKKRKIHTKRSFEPSPGRDSAIRKAEQRLMCKRKVVKEGTVASDVVQRTNESKLLDARLAL